MNEIMAYADDLASAAIRCTTSFRAGMAVSVSCLVISCFFLILSIVMPIATLLISLRGFVLRLARRDLQN